MTIEDILLASEGDADHGSVPESQLSRVLELFRAVEDRPGSEGGFAARLSRAAVRHGERRRVRLDVPEDELLTLLGGALPRGSAVGLDAYANMLANIVEPHTVNIAHSKCLAHMNCSPPPFMHELAHFVSRLNQNLVKVDASGVLSVIERQTLAMLHRLVFGCSASYYQDHLARKETALGIVASGGTLANLAGLWCARAACFASRTEFDDIEKQGLTAALRAHGWDGAVIVGSELMHYSIHKAAALLGLGSAGVVSVPVDACQRVDIDALEQAVERCARRRLRIVALVGVAGTTDCGSVDPLHSLARISRREHIHFHVDAAAGAALLFSERRRDLLTGLAEADSVTLDCHKQLLLPIGTGVLLLKNGRSAQVLEQSAPYMLHTESSDLGKLSLEGSRAGSTLLVHAAMRIVGPAGFTALVERHLEMASRFATLLEASDDFELLHAPQTNIVLYRYVPPALRETVDRGMVDLAASRALNDINEALQQFEYRSGRSQVSRTTVTCLAKYRDMRVVALRAVFNNPHTTVDDLQEVLDEQRQLACQVAAHTSFREYAVG